MSQSEGSESGKALAGARAGEVVEPGMKVGLGTGSTVAFFLQALGRRYRDGEVPGIVGVPTSLRTEKEARELGIPLATLEEVGTLDLTVDGADEVDPDLRLTKGLGGALLREKMVAQATRRLLIIVDAGKLVDRLGTRSPLPVEVVPFAWQSHLPFLEALGARGSLRENPDGSPFFTDNGNLVLDCRFPSGMDGPEEVEGKLAHRAGIVESGLFLGMTEQVYVGGDEGEVRILRAEKSGAR